MAREGRQPLVGATVRCDDHRARSVALSDPKRASKVPPGVHRIVSLVKRWLLGTHQSAVSEKHLSWYVQEYTFRFNRRRSTQATPASCSNSSPSSLSIHTTPTTYRGLQGPG